MNRDKELADKIVNLTDHLRNIEAQLIAARIAYMAGNWDALRQALDIDDSSVDPEDPYSQH